MSTQTHIILGVSGSIAAYKSAEIIRQLYKKGFRVSVVMTQNAERFITPLTLSVLCGQKVYRQKESFLTMAHIDLSREAELLLVAPATANIIGKAAHGIADDILSSLLLAFHRPIVFAPAMHTAMYQNPLVQDNIAQLKKHQARFVDPVEGELACGDFGEGRMAPVEKIVETVEGMIKT